MRTRADGTDTPILRARPAVRYRSNQEQAHLSEYPSAFYHEFYTGQGSYPWGSQLPAIPGIEPHIYVRASYNYWTHGQRQLDELARRIGTACRMVLGWRESVNMRMLDKQRQVSYPIRHAMVFCLADYAALVAGGQCPVPGAELPAHPGLSLRSRPGSRRG